MNIDKYTDAINNCRFCFMCRHLSAVGNVNFTEADTPRVRAAAIYGATKHPEWWGNADFIDMLYRSDLSKCCARHCVNHFDENGLVIAARTRRATAAMDNGNTPVHKEYLALVTGDFRGRVHAEGYLVHDRTSAVRKKKRFVFAGAQEAEAARLDLTAETAVTDLVGDRKSVV